MIPTRFDPRGDDRGVSPVIGVILMVAITVILAAVIGSFVLGIGGQQEAAPQASITITENEDGDVNINHRGGDEFSTANTAELNVSAGGNTYAAAQNGTGDADLPFGAGDTINTSEISTDSPSDEIGADGQVDVIWTGPQGSTQIIASRTF